MRVQTPFLEGFARVCRRLHVWLVVPVVVSVVVEQGCVEVVVEHRRVPE